MDPGFFSRPPGLWLATLGVAALLLGLGYEAAQQRLEPPLEQARRDLAEQTSRANRLEAENRSLETRLAQAQARLDTGLAAGGPEEERAALAGPRNRVLHQGEAAVLMDGKLVVHLEALLYGPRRAELRIKAAGRQEETRVMTAGQEMPLTVGGRHLRLTLKRILASSVIFSLSAPGE